MAVKLVLTGHGYRISKRDGLLVIYRSDGAKREFSVGNLSAVLANVRGLSISGDAVGLMLRHGVPLILTMGDRPIGRIQPMMARTNVRLKKEQVKAQNTELGMGIAKAIVMNKILNQVKVLKRLSKTRHRHDPGALLKLDEGVRGILNVYREVSEAEVYSRSWLVSKEAEAARHYWEALAGVIPGEVGFTGRKRRYDSPIDPFNLSLNYLYTLLMYQVWYAVELSGLDPFIGFLHEDSSRRPSLVMDLMEEFRQPVVDLPLINHFSRLKCFDLLDGEGRLNEGHRRELVRLFYESLERRVTFMNRSAPVKSHIRLQPVRLGKCLLGLLESYRCYDVVA